MPIIEIKMFEGRSRKQKEALARRITEVVCEAAGTTEDHVWITFSDYHKSDWAIAGELQDSA